METQELAIIPASNLSPVEVMKWTNKNFTALKGALVTGEQICTIEGKPYIKKSGWRNIAAAFGISEEIMSSEKTTATDDIGTYYVHKYLVKAIAPNGRFAMAEGACSSRDPFFAKSKGNYRPEHEINESDIILTAQTVAYNRAISDLVGGGELSAEEMQGKVTQNVSLQKPPATPVADPETGEIVQPPKSTADQQRASIGAMLFNIAGDGEKAKDLLEEITAWTKDGKNMAGKRELAALTDRQVPVILGKVEKAFKAFSENETEALPLDADEVAEAFEGEVVE